MRCLSPLLLLSALAIASYAEAKMKAGAAVEVITPGVGTPMAGYYHGRGADSVHDDLYSRTLVLEQDGTKVALVSLDLISTRREFVVAARTLIEERTGIPASHVMISATHTHTAPVLGGRPRDENQGGGNAALLEYLERLPEKIAASVEKANAKLAGCESLAAIGSEPAITFNRRFHMRDGTVGWNPGKMNPDIVKPAGPIDPSVPIVYFRTLEGSEPLAAYVNYSVHLDNVGGEQISADLPYTVTESLKAAVDKDLITVYTSGACGDLNHVDVTWGEKQKGHANAARMGTILAGEVLTAWRHLQPVEGKLQARSAIVQLELPEVTPEMIEAAKETLETGDDSTRERFMQLVHASKVIDVASRNGKPLDAEVQVVTLGSTLAWVALPGEIFVELGLDLKLDSPFPQTMVASLANGSTGYVPCARAFPQGNYEVVSSRSVVGSGERLVAAALDLLRQCYAELPEAESRASKNDNS